jgi:aminoglycoside phosphotransferase (APT) family kinase protein
MLHNDPNLDNFVFRDGRAVALIDFDLAAPGAPLWDVAATARLWAPLRSPADIADDRRDRALTRARILVDAYGLDEAGRAGLLDAVRASHDWMVGVVADGAAHGVPGFAAYWGPEAAARARRTDAWLGANAGSITSALLPP